jgi:uncharacterized protein (TIGR02246 family)
MRKVLIAGLLGLTFLLTGAGSAAGPQTGSPEDEAALRKLQEEFAAAWNQHDPTAMAKFWADDGDWLGPDGYFVQGRAAVESYLSEAHTGDWATSKNAITVTRIRFLKPDVAAVNAEYNLTGARDWFDNPIPNQKIVATSILVKKDGKWLTSVYRAFVPPPPPQE